MTLAQKIGSRILSVRKNLELTQEQFAHKLGVSDGAISSYEQGDSLPSIKNIIGIAKLSGISIDWLLTGAIMENTPPEEQGITEEEIRLLIAWRTAPKPRREIALEILENAPRSRAKKDRK